MPSHPISRFLNLSQNANSCNRHSNSSGLSLNPVAPQVSIKYSAPHERFNAPAGLNGHRMIPAFLPGQDINVTVEIANAFETPIIDLQLALMGEVSVQVTPLQTIRRELVSVGVSLADKIAVWGTNNNNTNNSLSNQQSLTQQQSQPSLSSSSLPQQSQDSSPMDVDQNNSSSSIWIPFRPTEALQTSTVGGVSTLAQSSPTKILRPGTYTLPLTITIPFFPTLPSSFRHSTHAVTYEIVCSLQLPSSPLVSLIGIMDNGRITASLPLNLIPVIPVPKVSPPIISDEILHPAGSHISIVSRRASSSSSSSSSSINDLDRSESVPSSTSWQRSSSDSSETKLIRSGNYTMQVYIPRRIFAQTSKVPISLHIVNHSDEGEGQVIVRQAFIMKMLVDSSISTSSNSDQSSNNRRKSGRTSKFGQSLRNYAFAWISGRNRLNKRVHLGSKKSIDVEMGLGSRDRDLDIDNGDDLSDISDGEDIEDEAMNEGSSYPSSSSSSTSPEENVMEMWKMSQIDEIRIPIQQTNEFGTNDSSCSLAMREYALSFSLDIPRGCGFSIPTTSTRGLFGVSFKVGIEIEFLHGRPEDSIPEEERDIVTIWVPITVGSVVPSPPTNLMQSEMSGQRNISYAHAVSSRFNLDEEDEMEMPPPVYEQAVCDVPAYVA